MDNKLKKRTLNGHSNRGIAVIGRVGEELFKQSFTLLLEGRSPGVISLLLKETTDLSFGRILL